MKKVFLTILALSFILGISVCSIQAENEYTIQPMYPDVVPGDGIMDRGSFFNPYVVKDPSGQQRAIIQPRYPDLNPNDGFMDPGTWSNPYVIKPQN